MRLIRFTIYLISLLVCLLAVKWIVYACADPGDPYDTGSLFFNDIKSRPAFKPFRYTTWTPYYQESDSVQVEDLNIKEWKEYTKGYSEESDISAAVYKIQKEEINQELNTIKNSNADSYKVSGNNSFFKMPINIP